LQVLILEEAGGKITTMDGKPYSVFERSVLASNGAMHKAILEKTNEETVGLIKGGIDLRPWYIPEGYTVDL
jgi:myo-inositol-1(or 4)-monophosphatase